ncbi:hypothetical protein ACO0LM_12005 [Undibacterium sp. Di26W]|uniref:hypothetical protein n=1 Tax=Undibacterium sp. Di26W TaxID=3413035 RepID=UPI003BF4468F
MDDVDRATAHMEQEHALRIQQALTVARAAERPELDCVDCSGITQEVAKEGCQHFATCLGDWQVMHRMKKVNGVK